MRPSTGMRVVARPRVRRRRPGTARAAPSSGSPSKRGRPRDAAYCARRSSTMAPSSPTTTSTRRNSHRLRRRRHRAAAPRRRARRSARRRRGSSPCSTARCACGGGASLWSTAVRTTNGGVVMATITSWRGSGEQPRERADEEGDVAEQPPSARTTCPRSGVQTRRIRSSGPVRTTPVGATSSR